MSDARLSELRTAVRGLARTPGACAVIVLTGAGVVTATGVVLGIAGGLAASRGLRVRVASSPWSQSLLWGRG